MLVISLSFDLLLEIWILEISYSLLGSILLYHNVKWNSKFYLWASVAGFATMVDSDFDNIANLLKVRLCIFKTKKKKKRIVLANWYCIALVLKRWPHNELVLMAKEMICLLKYSSISFRLIILRFKPNALILFRVISVIVFQDTDNIDEKLFGRKMDGAPRKGLSNIDNLLGDPQKVYFFSMLQYWKLVRIVNASIFYYF